MTIPVIVVLKNNFKIVSILFGGYKLIIYLYIIIHKQKYIMKTFGRIMIVILILLGLGFLGFGLKTCGIAEKHITNSMENAVISYDEYQNIYATCIQLNSDLGVIKSTPDNDSQFAQFSKAQRLNAIKQNLNRWIGEYNAKSKHIDKKYWKSNDLPYELSTTQFSNY